MIRYLGRAHPRKIARTAGIQRQQCSWCVWRDSKKVPGANGMSEGKVVSTGIEGASRWGSVGGRELIWPLGVFPGSPGRWINRLRGVGAKHEDEFHPCGWKLLFPTSTTAKGRATWKRVQPALRCHLVVTSFNPCSVRTSKRRDGKMKLDTRVIVSQETRKK